MGFIGEVISPEVKCLEFAESTVYSVKDSKPTVASSGLTESG